MSIPGYDAWKLMTPEEDYESKGGKVCPICGAHDNARCGMLDEPDGFCAWEEPDPDILMEQRREDREFEARNPCNGDDF
ncbi:hypothetical protein [Mesorhizobium sp.]|uniref:hypothetical protein n=1 Tax=Mesorhizobium sp. TaxID=1871066 RepID=UPI0011F91258|nr:hypothetical protein [Mesorhizobium sp.]TIX28784.1 MAG: hypothetical protein E5V35_00035 [Mesorhizobium sp.]